MFGNKALRRIFQHERRERGEIRVRVWKLYNELGQTATVSSNFFLHFLGC
jgi:hypothetical protein